MEDMNTISTILSVLFFEQGLLSSRLRYLFQPLNTGISHILRRDGCLEVFDNIFICVLEKQNVNMLRKFTKKLPVFQHKMKTNTCTDIKTPRHTSLHYKLQNMYGIEYSFSLNTN